MFQRARVLFGDAISVTSGCRCVKHNSSAAVKGKPDSAHLVGLALDVKPAKNNTPLRRIRLFECLKQAGFVRIGVPKNENLRIFHVDIDKSKPQGIFEY